MTPDTPQTLNEAAAQNLQLLIVVIVFYILAIGYIGFRGFRATRTATDYLLAGRNTHPFVMALSYGATFISTAAIVGFGGVAALMGMGLLWLTFLNIFVGIFIAFVFLGKRTRRMGHNLDAHSFPELLGRRFQSRFIQLFVGLIIFVLMPLYAAAVLRGGAEFIRETFHIPIEVAILIFALFIAAYVIAGGLKGVMMTDALQGAIMFVGMAVLLVITYVNLGGVVAAHEALTNLAPLVPEALQAAGHRGWTSMPAFPSPLWNSMVTTIVLGVGLGVLAQPQLAVRFMTVKSGKQLNRAVLVGSIFILFMTGVAFIVGALSNVYFFNTEGKIAVAVVAQGNVDAIIPRYINMAMPSWFVVIFMLTLLSAAMSTISSQFHTMGTAIGRDVCERGLGLAHLQDRSTLITRGGVMVAFLITLTLSLNMPPSIIASATALFFGVCAIAFLPMFVGALYSRRMTREGAIWGMLVGVVLALVWLLFFHASNATRLGLCQWLFDRPTLIGAPWSQLDPLVIALPLSAAVTIIVSALTRPPDREHLDKCFEQVR